MLLWDIIPTEDPALRYVPAEKSLSLYEERSL